MAYMQMTGNRWGRGVDRIYAAAFGGVPETVGSRVLPLLAPLVFQSVHAHMVGQRSQVGMYAICVLAHRA